MEYACVAMKGTGSWVGSDAHGLFRVQLLRSTARRPEHRGGGREHTRLAAVPATGGEGGVVPEQPQMMVLKLLLKGSLRFLGSQGLGELLQRMMSGSWADSARASPAVLLGSVPPPVDLKGPMQ